MHKALKAATPSLRDLAKAAGVSYYAIRLYAKKQRTAPTEVVRRLARALRAQGDRLAKLAAELEAAAEK